MNIKAIEVVTEHVLTKAKAYVATIGTTASLILNSQLHLNPTAHLVVAIASIVGVGLSTFIVPNKQAGITLGEAVAADGPIFLQAAEALKALPLPGPATQIISQVEAAAPQVAAIAEQAEPAIEALVPAAAPAVEAVTDQSLTQPAAQ